MTGIVLHPFQAAKCPVSPQFTHFGSGIFPLILQSRLACSPPHLAYVLLGSLVAGPVRTGRALHPFQATKCPVSPQFTHSSSAIFSLMLQFWVVCYPPHLIHFGRRWQFLTA
ncbi:hypothetical protein AVEN_226794-1 [Araneus ventricosus]|uniref:Uncharacterized protein n=1 Tax=Araneus ventricosus TaxID=182803 RepID=A0A4Y2LDL6_ARAVE|nr:hypothetical protein AVEN_226794-1 [Araneus ventricosus]